jgi:hypothetical protein
MDFEGGASLLWGVSGSPRPGGYPPTRPDRQTIVGNLRRLAIQKSRRPSASLRANFRTSSRLRPMPRQAFGELPICCEFVYACYYRSCSLEQTSCTAQSGGSEVVSFMSETVRRCFPFCLQELFGQRRLSGESARGLLHVQTSWRSDC